MTLQELLSTPLMNGASVIIGAEHLDWEITGYIPETSVASNQWLTPGLLYICNDQQSDSYRLTHLDTIINSYGCGLLLFGENTLSQIDKDAIAHLDAALIPIIQMPKSLSPLTFIKKFSLLSNQSFSIEALHSEWLSQICSGQYKPTHEEYAKSYGYNSAYLYTCVMLVLQNPPLNPFWDEVKLNEAKNILTRELSYSNASFFAYLRQPEQKLICMIPSIPHLSARDARARINKAVDRLYRVLFDCQWNIYVGPSVSSLKEFLNSYTCTIQTETIVNVLNSCSKINFYDDWYPLAVLLNRPRSELRKQMELYLAPLLDKKELLDSLISYLVYGENIKETAEKTFMHVNTLRYRIQKISEILDCNLDDPNTRFQLRSMVAIYLYLKNTEENL